MLLKTLEKQTEKKHSLKGMILIFCRWKLNFKNFFENIDLPTVSLDLFEISQRMQE